MPLAFPAVIEKPSISGWMTLSPGQLLGGGVAAGVFVDAEVDHRAVGQFHLQGDDLVEELARIHRGDGPLMRPRGPGRPISSRVMPYD